MYGQMLIKILLLHERRLGIRFEAVSLNRRDNSIYIYLEITDKFYIK